MLVIVPVIIMIIIAAYAFSAIAPGAVSIPMQWSPGEAHFLLPRLFAFAAIPAIGIVVLLILNYASVGSTATILVAVLFIAIQLLHVGLAHRWFAKTRT
jgi:hypothetical protein